MSTDVHVIELLAAYALGSLDEEEAAQVEAHLATCPGCRAELQSYEALAERLALAAPDAVPPAKLKQQILRQLQVPRTEPVKGPRRSWWQWLAGLFEGAGPAWGIASLVLLAVLVVSNLWWWQRANREEPLVTAGAMQVVAMVGTDAAPDAVGTLVISEDGEYGTLVVDKLPPLDQDYQYQLWLIHDGQRTSGGVFSVNREGYGALWVSSPDPLSSYPAFGITIEPAGGSSGPTGDKVLGGSL
jgi:anti-sigma-K factor RskA